MIITDSLFGDFVALLIGLVAYLILYWKRCYQYWENRNLPSLEPRIPFGNFAASMLRRENFCMAVKRVYDEMKEQGWKHGGVYVMATPNYFLVDLEYIKNVMAKDFQYFTDRGYGVDEKKTPLNGHLALLGGQKWRNLRTKLTPTFTSGKMKMMFQTLADCQVNLLKKIDEEIVGKRPMDIKEIIACYTTDIIGSCAFGIECNSFEDQDSPFRRYGKETLSVTKMQHFIRIFATNFPKLAGILQVGTLAKGNQSEVHDFFMKLVKDTVGYREQNNVTRNDFLQLLMELKNNDALTIEQVAAQCFVFFLGGFETSSTLMSFVLYELARDQEMQQKVRDEINQVLKKHGSITYDSLQDMKYMQKVIDEALRKYPPVPFINRKCVQDYKIQDEDVIVEKGTVVLIPVVGIHYDKEYYPDPEKFDPERFNEENKNSRHGYAYIPFGEGPRICIGARFGLMQSKCGLSCLLRNYKFTVNKKTLEPLRMRVDSVMFAAEGEIWLDATKL